MRYQYQIRADDSVDRIFTINLDDEGKLDSVVSSIEALTAEDEWQRLAFHQCPHCPLSVEDVEYCPLAKALAPVLPGIDDLASHVMVNVWVTTDRREIRSHVSAQTAVSSLLGGIIGACGCPHTLFFKPMARFHLPLADDLETIYRVGGTFLLYQYYAIEMQKTKGHQQGIDGLRRIYENMHVVNQSIAKRIRSVAQADSAVNAMVILDLFTKTLPYCVEDALADIRPFFEDYLNSPLFTFGDSDDNGL